MKYKQLLPPSYLKDYIRYFWTLESDALDKSPKNFGVIVDGCPGILFQHIQKGKYYDQDNKQLPGIFLYGQATKHIKLYSRGTLSTVGICFHANALKAIFGFSASELTNSCLDINLLSGYQESRLVEKLLNTLSVTAQIETLSSYLFSRIRKNTTQSNETSYALSQIISSQGNISLRKLREDLQISEKTLERKFKEWVGISPKLFSRICRFQTSLYHLRNNKYEKLSDIAFDNGYTDQSYFTKVFKEFTGFSPNQYQKRSTEVVENFFAITS